MKILLLSAAILLSAGVILLAFLFLSGKLTSLVYTVCSAGISVLLIFALFHFVYLYLNEQKRK